MSLQQKGSVDKSGGGYCDPYGACLSSLFLSRIGLTISVPVLPISDAVHCNRSRSALHPPLQCTASVPAVHCLFSRKYVQPSPQVRAIVPASTCVRTCKYVNPFLQVFLLNPENGGLITKAKSRILQNHRISCLIQIKALFLPLDYEP